jgi:hypothetical protein
MVNSTETECGVYQFGHNLYHVFEKYPSKYEFSYFTTASMQELEVAIRRIDPAVIIYNYHPWTMRWLDVGIKQMFFHQKHVAIIHEETKAGVPSNARLYPFTYSIRQDPTGEEAHNVYVPKARNIFNYTNTFDLPEIPTIGSFGFAWEDKGFHTLVSRVIQEYDEAVVRLHLAKSHYGDPAGHHARNMADRCTALTKGTNITIEASFDWKPVPDLLDWLAQNTANAFFYDRKEGRGISGPLDFALSVKRPIVLTKSYMFKHLWGVSPSIFIEDRAMKEIIADGITPLAPIHEQWGEEAMLREYIRILDDILGV